MTKPLTKDEVGAAEKLCEQSAIGGLCTECLYYLIRNHDKGSSTTAHEDDNVECASFPRRDDKPSIKLMSVAPALLPRALADLRAMRGLLERAPDVGCSCRITSVTCNACTWNAERKRATEGWK